MNGNTIVKCLSCGSDKVMVSRFIFRDKPGTEVECTVCGTRSTIPDQPDKDDTRIEWKYMDEIWNLVMEHGSVGARMQFRAIKDSLLRQLTKKKENCAVL